MLKILSGLTRSRKVGHVLKFIVGITEDRTDASDLRKVAKRRLGFLNKDGFDRFGNNKLFAPLSKWSAIKREVEAIRVNAQSYEDAYNDVKMSLERQDDLKEVLRALPVAASIQVRARKKTDSKRLEQYHLSRSDFMSM
ncbi:hypothetical protein OS493_035743 [Desmophyllum pertusum]|uniref:Uncharacterized protein n=1 Tax=Desmophyllum pertusum TaxID=174260 RepID=A0A9W9ZVR2_9CNID|nr:hypothetical protein OS493_035743 [Desmophyllum pertusum]